MDYGRGWQKGKNATLYFYRNKLKWKVEQFNHKFPLHMYFAPMIGSKKKIEIADVGAGMFSTTGNLWYQTEVKVVPSDILADEFNKILSEFHVVPVIPIEKQDMEKMTYKDESFDIVHSVNALDHCQNPDNAIREMYRICKREGWIYLRHVLNNADLRRKTGFHQWNIYPFGKDCIFDNGNRKFYLSDIMHGFYTEMKKEIGNEPEMVVSKLYKS